MGRKSLFIANRGEVAMQVLRAVTEAGLSPVTPSNTTKWGPPLHRYVAMLF